MRCISRGRDRDRLEQELQTKEYEKLLKDLGRRYPFLRQFETWACVLAFMRDGTSNDPLKDETLRPILQSHYEDQDPRWRTILLVIFWPGLESIHFRKRGWDSDPDELWQNIVWIFLRVIYRVDVRRRRDRLVQKVFNDTIHHLHDEYQRAWNREKHEICADHEEIEILAGGLRGIDFEGIYLREKHQLEVKRLRQHLHAGRINDADFLLLVGTRLYGRSVADYARAAGIDYQVAKKRRQRAEAAIRRFEEDNR